MKTRTITLGGKELPIRWTEKSTFRLSNMGFQSWDEGRGLAFMAAMVAAAIDTPKQLYTAEQTFELLSELDEESSASEIVNVVMEAFEEANEGKLKKLKKSGRSSGSK